MNALSKKKFYPVIHCVDPNKEQGVGHAILNTRTAIENEADGVFLIGHSINYSSLSHIYDNVRKHFPNFWVGINFLDLSPTKNWTALSGIVMRCHKLSALWTDGIPDKRFHISPSIEIFVGVAFKYMAPHLEGKALAQVCTRAIEVADVATTSGDKTGSPPEITKLETIKRNLGGKIPLALASGVSSENVHKFFPTIDRFLVASSITERRSDYGGYEYLVSNKVRELADLVHRKNS